MSDETDYRESKPQHHKEEHRPSVEDRLDQLYSILAGNISGKPGLIQVVAEHEKLLNDRRDGVVPAVAKLKQDRNYVIGWIAGASAVTAVVVWFLDHMK